MTFIFDKPAFQTLQATFKQYANQNSNSASDMILYNIIRGKDIKRGFTPITNSNRLANGADPWYGYKSALSNLRWNIKRNKILFGQPLTDEQAASIISVLEA